MAWGLLPTPGKIINGIEVGPCVEPCAHRDCAETRRQAATACRLCGEPVGYETPFYRADEPGALEHVACAETAAGRLL